MVTVMRSTIFALTTLSALLACVFGCSVTSQPEPEPSAPFIASASASARSRQLHYLPGYVHDHQRSKFAKGSLLVSRSELGADRYVGEHGVFAFRPQSGLSVGIPNGDSPIAALPRMAGSAEDHNQAVRSYFVAGGLPDDQISRVDALARMSQSYGDGTSSTPQLICWNSMVHRQAGGVQVRDSYAWARFNVVGQVVAEGVHWPELPAGVIADAAALSAIAKAPGSLATLRAKLPADLQTTPGEVMIHHTPGEWAGAFVAAATFDMTRNGRVLHFDKNGVEVQFPNEKRGAYGTPPPSSK